MKMIIPISLVCLLMMSCNSSSPQSEYKRQIKQIQKEQKRENEEFAKFVERNPDVILGNDSADNNRIISGDEQLAIANNVASAMGQDLVTQPKPNRKVGKKYSGFYENSLAKYSIQFPNGWVIQETYAGKGTVIAKDAENGSTLKVSREYNSDNSPLTLNKAKMVGDKYLGQLQQHEPSVRILNADLIKDFNGHQAILTLFKLPGANVFSLIFVPYKQYAYVIGFEGPEDVFRGSALSSIASFKIL